MQTPPISRPKTPRTAHIGLRPDDFLRLGLGPTEARVTVIRRAAWQLATPLVDPNQRQRNPEKETELALLLASAYRLLDPRRRDHFVERVQLLRSEPIPLRSHLWDWGGSEEVDVGDAADAETASTEPNYADDLYSDDLGIEEGSDTDTEPHDWMLNLIADMRTDATQPIAAPPIQFDERKTNDVVPADRKHLLEVAKTIGRKRWVKYRGVAAVCGLVLVLGSLLTGVLALRSEPAVQPQADVQTTIADTKPARGKLLPSMTLASGTAREAEIASGANVPPPPNDVDSGSPITTRPIQPEQPLVEPPSEIRPPFEVTAPQPQLEAPHPVFVIPQPAPFPAVEQLDVAKRQLREFELTDAEAASMSAVELWQRRLGTVSGSAERLAIGLGAILRAVLADEEALSIAMAEKLSREYETSPLQLLAMTVADAEPRAVTKSEQEPVIRFALRASDLAITEERFVLATEIARVGTALAASHGDNELKKRFKQRRDAIATAERMAQTFHQETSRTTVQTADRSAALAAARHFCINLRRWPEGLPWMAVGSDLRLAALAEEELALKPDAGSLLVASLAHRWLEQAERRRGREMESIQLHAIDLITLAIGRSQGLEKLELERELETLKVKLPLDVLPLELSEAMGRL